MLSKKIRKLRKLIFNPKLYLKDMIANLEKKERQNKKKIDKKTEKYDIEYINEEEYKNKINDNSIRVLSFDIFDTLITRPLEDPFGVFSLLAMKVQDQLGLTLERFVFVRHNADVYARKRTAPHEASLRERYNFVQKIYNLSNDQVQKIINLELEIEFNLCKPRGFGKKLFMLAKNSYKPIVLISDMYFGEEHIRRMLIKCGYPLEGVKIFISCDCGTYKGADLYQYVSQKINCPPNSILHTGDNIHADINFAQKHGYKTYQIKSSRETMLENSAYKKVFPANGNYNGTPILIESVFSGLIATKLFDTPIKNPTDSLFLKKRYNLGYAGIGPAIFSYILWLQRIATKEQISHLYFLSREGLLLQKAYNILFKDKDGFIKNTYTYNSTRAIRVASLRNETDIANLALQPFITGVTIKELMSYRFGINIKYGDERILKSGFKSANEKLQNNADYRIKFINICNYFSKEILENAKHERKYFTEYLEKIGLFSETNPGLVDIGWSANSIVFYRQLMQKPLNIFYYCAFQNAVSKLGLQGKGQIVLHSFAGHFFKHPGIFNLPAFSPITEILVCSHENSFSHFEHCNGELKPVFRKEQEDLSLSRKEMVHEVHQGALDFIKDISHHFYNFFDYLYPSPAHAESVYAPFLTHPTFQDAMLLKNIAYENMFSGISEGFVVAPSKDGISSWKQGHSVIYQQ